MTSSILHAQQWVNATYSGVDGFTPVKEDGIAGWETLHALTRALQHELGVTALSDSFGPTTLSLLTQRGGVKLTEPNGNIVRIVQCACYCKGYDPGSIRGTFDRKTQKAVRELMSHAGLEDEFTDAVPPKVVKAALTMDSYLLVAGGTAAVRSVQQWLNGRYWGRQNFFVLACDGKVTREVMKALHLTIQFELGMTDADATGVFDPGTRAGLDAHPLSKGSGGSFVQLFTAAMVLNRVHLGDLRIYERFTDTFDTEVAQAVCAFQAFSALPVTGAGDYATWCQLLVSDGDPTRACAAADCITAITDERAATLRTAGCALVGRYLDERPSKHPLNKQLQPGELDVIFRNGLKVFPISQYYGGDASYFTHAQGLADAEGAHDAAVRYGFDQGTVIYFAVDFDATQSDVDSHVIPYFQGVVAGLAGRGDRYVHGVYGSRNVCSEVTRWTGARWSYVAGMSTGYSGNLGYPLPENWSFNQVQTTTLGSGDGQIEIDRDAYRPGTDPGVSAVGNPATSVDTFLAYIARLYDLAVGYGKGDPNRLVLEYLRHEDYGESQWALLLGAVDQGFVDHVNKAGVTMVRTMADPVHGIPLRMSHMGAAGNAVHMVGKPIGPQPGTNTGDLAGWGGDLITFFGEWQRDVAKYPDGYSYCRQKLGRHGSGCTFELYDLVMDADGYNIAMHLRSDTSIVQAMEANYRTDPRTRLTRFFSGRFDHDVNRAKDLARDMLTSEANPLISAGRAYLIQATAGTPVTMPQALPAQTLEPFCRGFAEVLSELVRAEPSATPAHKTIS
jgi:peptidoglycan hydrolase-like protein with peptidoglycan-binding domain